MNDRFKVNNSLNPTAEKNNQTIAISISINGTYYTADVRPKITLAELLREKFNLTGTKLGCNRAECGVCTVLLDGIPVFSCTVLAVEANHKRVDTIEGLSSSIGGGSETGRFLQEAFVKSDALQCGFCTPGILLCLKDLLDRKREATLEEIKEAIAGNYCRCGAYPNIFNAAMKASMMAREEKIREHVVQRQEKEVLASV
jgi:aerobic-type carbon monoxide dehydrogenase small subunit (CoxS/CutS family)